MKLIPIIILTLFLTVGLNGQDEVKIDPNIDILKKQIQQLQNDLNKAREPQRAQEIRTFIEARIKTGKAEMEKICKANNAKWTVTFFVVNGQTVISTGCVGR